jgi:iron(III) transport system permease protein
VVLGITVAWLVERGTVTGRGLIGSTVMVAYGFPSIILGVGVMLGYIGVLYGTLTIILIAYVARHLPIGFVLVRSLFKQVSPELEEAARILGAGRLRSLIDITYPVLRPAAFIAWLLIFSLCLREQPMSAILTQSGTEVMSTMVLQFIEDGSIEVAAAIAVLIVVVSMATIGVARIFAPREILEMR